MQKKSIKILLLTIGFLTINGIVYCQDEYFSYNQNYWDVTLLTDFEHGAGVQLNYNSPKAIGGYLTLMSEKIVDESLEEFNRTINLGATFSSKYSKNTPNMLTLYAGAAFSQIQTLDGKKDQVGLNVGVKSTSDLGGRFGINLLAGFTMLKSFTTLEVGIGATF